MKALTWKAYYERTRRTQALAALRPTAVQLLPTCWQ